jgi:hypothetical protein
MLDIHNYRFSKLTSLGNLKKLKFKKFTDNFELFIDLIEYSNLECLEFRKETFTPNQLKIVKTRFGKLYKTKSNIIKAYNYKTILVKSACKT